MNPAKPATTRLEQMQRAVMIARTLPPHSVAGYLRRIEMNRPDQLSVAVDIKAACGVATAAAVMRALGWSIEGALLTLCGTNSLERHLNRTLDKRLECCA